MTFLANRRLRSPLRSLLTLAAALFLSLPVWAFAQNQDTPAQRVKIVEPYVELHTGPGRHYPIFFAEERGRWVNVIMRRTDWFLVVTDEGKRGWVSRAQLEQTLTESGEPKQFRDKVIDDYLRRRLEVGLAGGKIEGQTHMTVRANYQLAPTLGSEFAISQISGTFSSATVYSAHLLAQPFVEWRYAPFFSLGIGHFSDTPRGTLIDPSKNDSLSAIYGFGLRAYLTRRFVLRADYRNHVIPIDDNDAREYDEYTAGFSFFF